jgi:hypothetical protein
VSKKS